MTKTIAISAVLICTLGVTGCASAGKALGLTREGPNEFNILTKAPLVVPPEYKLRPPQVGEARAEESYSSEVAREAIMGDVDSAAPSQGEILLMSKAGAGRSDGTVRMLIDGDNSVERKSAGFTDRVVFWRDGQAVDGAGNPLDPDNEAKRLESVSSVTGGGKVAISKRPTGSKLPGL